MAWTKFRASCSEGVLDAVFTAEKVCLGAIDLEVGTAVDYLRKV